MVRLLKNKEMKEYLENRIKELREADAKFCNDRWDMSKHQLVRAMARENSNSVTLARQELETALKFFNNLTIPVVGVQSEPLFCECNEPNVQEPNLDDAGYDWCECGRMLRAK